MTLLTCPPKNWRNISKYKELIFEIYKNLIQGRYKLPKIWNPFLAVNGKLTPEETYPTKPLWSSSTVELPIQSSWESIKILRPSWIPSRAIGSLLGSYLNIIANINIQFLKN